MLGTQKPKASHPQHDGKSAGRCSESEALPGVQIPEIVASFRFGDHPRSPEIIHRANNCVKELVKRLCHKPSNGKDRWRTLTTLPWQLSALSFVKRLQASTAV